MASFSTRSPLPKRRSGCTALAPSSGLLLSKRRRRLPPAATMIIYRDLISCDEMFSDIYKIREIAGRAVPGGGGEDGQ
ncbi:Translationally-controlled tumor protein [Tupaia chinensis]|uniref:Translationally-controlled tumor protein n=1 Tax=Tupaia chinensis TaxID=246437 RepID=L9LF49_TUPCH|nr:Translationally-controlled tumor protein [Tupaia chinensis]